MTHETVKHLELLNEAGITVVMVTHNPGVADQAKRTVRLVDGRLVE
jgi:putative ABC transport system ATP-binding protein